MKRALTRILVALLLLVLLLVGWRAYRSRTFNRELAEIRAAGLPTNGDELNRWYAVVPERQNAALVVTQAIGLLREFPSTDARYWEIKELHLPARGQGFAPKQLQLLSEYVAMNTPALEKVREIARFPGSRYPLDLRDGPGTLLPHLRLKALAKLEQFSAVCALETIRSNQALVSIRSILELARTLESEPVTVSQMERTRVLACAKATLEYSLARASFGSEDLAALQSAFANSEKTNLMRRALIGDRATLLPLFTTNITEIERMWKEFDREDRPSQTGPRAWYKYRERDLSVFLRVVDTNLAALTLSYPANLIAESNAVAIIAAARQKGLVVSAICMYFQPAGERERAGFTHLRLSSTALAIERFRLTRNRLPASLDELVPEFLPTRPVDPFNGESLQYKRLTKGYTLQSTAKAMEDDPDPWIGVNSDFSFTVER